MKPANRPQLLNLPPLRLFGDDLAELIGIFKKHCQVVTISNEKYTYDSLEEMAKSDRNPGVFQLVGLVPRVELWIKSRSIPNFNRSALFSPEYSDAAQNLFLAVKDFLLARRWKSNIVLLNTALAVFGTGGVAAAFLKDAFHPQWHGASVILDLASLFALALFFAAVIKRTQSMSSVSLAPRSQEPFWQRNRDKLLLVLVSAVVSSALTLVVTWITLHYLNPPTPK